MINRISRRRLLRGAAGAGLLGLAVDHTFRQRPRALALIGARYHNADYIHGSLDRLFREVGIPVDWMPIIFSGAAASEVRVKHLP
jgi:hypothetical protein